MKRVDSVELETFERGEVLKAKVTTVRKAKKNYSRVAQLPNVKTNRNYITCQ